MLVLDITDITDITILNVNKCNASDTSFFFVFVSNRFFKVILWHGVDAGIPMKGWTAGPI